MFESILNFLSNHFEHILAINVFGLIGMAVIWIAVKVRRLPYPSTPRPWANLEQALYCGVTGGEVVLLSLTVVIFLTNLKPKTAIDASFPILTNTDWVKEDFKIYFIVDNKLVTMRINGKGRRTVFETENPVREYQFSPDSRYILITTSRGIFTFDRFAAAAEKIDGIEVPPPSEPENTARGVISGAKWNPAGDKLCYRIAQWSKYSSRDHWYVYDLKTRNKTAIKSPTRVIPELFWDARGENLYYSWFDALDTSVRGNPYEVKVYKLPPATLQPELVLKFPYKESYLPAENLALHGIHLFSGGEDLSFGLQEKRKTSWSSRTGARIGIDNDNYLYYVPSRWWRKRLYKIPRAPRSTDFPRYEYEGGQLAINHPRWLPSGRYVIMEHYFFGIVVLDPASGKLGIVANDKGITVGWPRQENPGV